MSLIYDLKQLQAAAKKMEEKVEKKQKDLFGLVNALVKWRQQCRLNKDYATSDKIRDLLKEIRVEITNGSIDLPPEKWGNLQHNDTWKQE